MTIAQQRPVIERVRQSTNSVCQGFSKTSQVHNGSFDTYTIFNSTIGDEEFAFDNEVINTQVYRRVLNKASKAQVLQNADGLHEPELFDEPLIDLSDEPKAPNVPPFDDFRAGSRWFGSFDGALPAELPGDSALVGLGDERAQDPTSLGDTASMQDSGHVPLSDRLSLKSRFAEPSVAEDGSSQAYKALDIEVVACRKEQETRREQYFNKDDSDDVGDGYEADNEMERNKKLAREGGNQEAHLAVNRQQMMNGIGEQPPDLPSMQLTVQPSITPENPPRSRDARVSGSSNLSKATVTADDTHASVPEDIASEHTYETAPPSPLIEHTKPLPCYNHVPSSFESLNAVIPPLNRPISRSHSDASGYESVRDLHTSSLPRRPPSLQMKYRSGALSGVAISKSSQSLGWIEPPDFVGAKQPDRYIDKSAGSSGFTHDHITPWQADNGKPFPPTINMQRVSQAKIERSGSESHDFISSALIWLVDPDSYTIKDSVVSNSISETTILLLGSMSGKTSACRTYAAQSPELTDYAALTASFKDYEIRIPMIINRFGVTQESIVTLRDTGADLTAQDIDTYSRHADVILLCYPVSEGSFDNVSEYVGACPYMSLPFAEPLKWFPQIREQCPKAPVILVGMRTDERQTAKGEGNSPASSYEEGLACAKANNTAAYVECSSTNLRSINQMFETAVRLALVSKLKVQQVQSPPLKHRLSRWWKGNKARQSTSSYGST